MGDKVEIDRKAFYGIKKQFSALMLGIVVFITAYLGLLAQPEGLLSVFWPANPVLAALMIRFPQLRTVEAWFCAFTGFVVADVLIGNGVLLAILLNLTNCIFAAAYLKLFTRLSPIAQKLHTPKSILYLLGVNIIAVTISTVTFLLLVYPFFPGLFGGSLWMGVKSWFTAGLVNNILIVPVILLAPSYAVFKAHCRLTAWFKSRRKNTFKQYLPLVALLLSPVFSVWIGGLCALVLHVPALLWCALNYQLFSTALLTLLMSIWLIIALNFGWIALIPQTQTWTADELESWVISMRVGIALLSLIPVMIATSHHMQNRLMRQLEHTLKYDFLTQILSRRAFFHSAQNRMMQIHEQQGSLCICMLDLDYFKCVNDNYGHAMGDKVLREFALIVKSNLRDNDIFARMGGEEFALLIDMLQFDEALAIAERIRQQIAMTPILEARQVVNITVSIGMVYVESLPSQQMLEGLLIDADKALYRAKQAGRNRIEHTIHQSVTG